MSLIPISVTLVLLNVMNYIHLVPKTEFTSKFNVNKENNKIGNLSYTRLIPYVSYVVSM